MLIVDNLRITMTVQSATTIMISSMMGHILIATVINHLTKLLACVES